MIKYKIMFLLTIMLASSGIWTQNSLAALGLDPMPNAEGLTIEEAEKKYGFESGYDHPLVFEVNGKLGPEKCEIIAPDCSKACPISKIYYQSPHHYLNRDGSRTVRVDIYFDVNQVTTSRDPSC
ncbi:4Fe-4S ferredoxin-type domain-containing protein [Candidatus Electrothrix laxa]